MQRSTNNQAGFTLLEVFIIVVAIIILLAIVYFR
jgi:Tfp pilus assembly protein PilE